ncbi:MAG TPA: DUF11 domain-containing protein [Gemmatimonadaceae bacterium]|nr:DUF11 domain-containing protein [Gemmatimonadaceae bacterium]
MSRRRVSGPGRGPARTPPASALGVGGVAAFVLALLLPQPAHAVSPRDDAALVPKSDMVITGTASAGFATGGNATYTLTLNNNGPQSAAGPITVTNTLPAGLTYTSATASAGWACGAAGQVVTCTWAASYFKNVATTITIVAFITSAAATSVTNVATVSYPGNDDADLTNNTASTTSAVTVRRVATTPDGAAATQLPSNGTNYTQTFVLTNNGSVSDSYNVVASVAPAGIVTIVSVNGVAGSSATTAATASGATRNVAVVYSVATAAATGASATITLTATSTATTAATDAGDLTVTVTRAGVAMTKQLYRDDRTTLVGAGAVTTGEYVQYRVTVTNGGGAAAAAVSITDPIPGQVTYDSASPDAAGWTIATAAGTLTADLAGTLATGASRFFWIRVRVK